MAIDEKDEKPSFKVVDRRASVGEETAPKEEPKRQESVPLKERPPLSFSLFIQSLAHQAMVGLGIAPWPDSGLLRAEPNLAKEMIDILIILQKKTAGNLDKEEQVLLDTMVYQLQVAFVEITNKPQDGLIK